MNIMLKIEFDGTNYSGWQRQNNAITIQETIEDAIHALCGEFNGVTGCSRTDAGVHAKGYIANFNTECSIPAERISYALNSKLPDDIVIISSEKTDDNFHARYSSKGKTYSYTIYNGEYKKALYRNYLYSYNKKLNISSMKKAAGDFIGTYDFSAFKSTGGSTKTQVRTVNKFDIEIENDFIKFFISANGFLYNMARIMAGTVVEAGLGKDINIKKIIESKDRSRAGKTLPAKGLCLEKVYY